jgi:hypothetical protein
VSDQPQKGTARPKAQTEDDALQQAREDVLTADQKHQNYLADLERLRKESVVDSSGNTPRAG